MSELAELYQQVIIDHSKSPRNFGKLDSANYTGEGYNPLCGDKVTVYAEVEDGVVKDIKFEGSGCAISTAAASLMTQVAKGRPQAEVAQLFEAYHRLVQGGDPGDIDLGKLAVFAGVSEFPSRVKCASLAWHTLNNALKGAKEVAKTE